MLTEQVCMSFIETEILIKKQLSRRFFEIGEIL